MTTGEKYRFRYGRKRTKIKRTQEPQSASASTSCLSVQYPMSDLTHVQSEIKAHENEPDQARLSVGIGQKGDLQDT